MTIPFLPVHRFWVLAKAPGSCNRADMFDKTLTVIFSGFLVCSALVHAQEVTDLDPTPTEKAPKNPEKADTPRPDRFWQASLPGGSYLVPLDRITSVSRHKYVLDGAVIVDEVTVDTIGQALVRFYFISPITDAVDSSATAKLANRGRELVDKVAQRAGTDVQDMVVKKYPETTHSKTIEFRLLSEAELSSLHSSVNNAWTTGKGRNFALSK